MRDEERADFEARIKRARAEGLAEGLARGLAKRRALKRAEVSEILKKMVANYAEKLHCIKCSLLKMKILFCRAKQRASRRRHVQQPDGSRQIVAP